MDSQKCTQAGSFLVKLCLLIIVITSSSCAAILNGRYQKVTIKHDKKSTLYVDGEKAKKRSGKYLLERDRLPKQLTLKREGYKDVNMTVMQHKRPFLYYLSWFPFGTFYLIPPLLDRGPRSYDFDRIVDIKDKPRSFTERDSLSKQMMLNNVAVKLTGSDIQYRYFPTYKSFKNKGAKVKAEKGDKDEKIELENTIFVNLMNKVLKEKGYIDTTNRVFVKSYMNNITLDATVVNYTVHNVSNFVYEKYGGMVYVDVKIKWDVLDFYKESIFSLTTSSTSGQFAITDYTKRSEVTYEAVKDAMEFGLIEFFNEKKVIDILHDKGVELVESSFDEITLTSSASFASTVPEAVKSSVTIMTKEGHGSGFAISEDGYIVTNYHVVSDTNQLKVVLNDLSEHSVKIVRASKIADLALLKINHHFDHPLRISEMKTYDLATDVFAVGTPTSQDLAQTVSKGIVSGIRTVDSGAKLIQTDASINGGNSGGAIITKESIVLGVVSSKLIGTGIEGVAFGIPAYEILERLKVRVP